ncbi:MAG: glycosyltransferase family 4 protein [Bacteroidales bacterium]|nr:glycosyltransferase family 4 protein [Bacteroidales bacterium]
MKLLYTIHSLYNPGGMERVLLNKIGWLRRNTEWEILVVTTDQKGRDLFFPLPEGVRMVDLGVNYSDDNGKSFICKVAGYFRRRRLHRKRLTELLMAERPDVVDCLYPGECSFVPDIRDGSRKVMELHQSKMFHYQYNRSGLLGLADRYRARTDERLVRRFDRFVVLTEEDARMWGEIPGMRVIPNAAKDICDGMRPNAGVASLDVRRVIAVGRLDYQKGFDRLIDAWVLVRKDGRFADWRLDIFGQGEWKEMLQRKIRTLGVGDSARLNAPVKDIAAEYKASSMLVMSSHYEGFPMVMVEAMSAGLPVVTFDYKCGPKDIIDDGRNGLLVKEGDIRGLADAMMSLMASPATLRRMSVEAKKVTERFSEEKVMGMWVRLYEGLLKYE